MSDSESQDGGNAPVSGPKVLEAPDEAATALRSVVEHRRCRVVDASVVDRLEELSAAIERAEKRAEELVDAAHGEADEIRREAREAGRREGYEELLEQIAAVRQRYRKLQEEAEEDMLELAFRIARRLVGRELERDPSVIRDIVEQAMDRVRDKRHVVVRVHPADAEVFEDESDAFSEQLDGATVYIEADREIDRGGCILETDANRVDARLDVQLERLREVLTDRGGDGDGGT